MADNDQMIPDSDTLAQELLRRAGDLQRDCYSKSNPDQKKSFDRILEILPQVPARNGVEALLLVTSTMTQDTFEHDNERILKAFQAIVVRDPAAVDLASKMRINPAPAGSRGGNRNYTGYNNNVVVRTASDIIQDRHYDRVIAAAVDGAAVDEAGLQGALSALRYGDGPGKRVTMDVGRLVRLAATPNLKMGVRVKLYEIAVQSIMNGGRAPEGWPRDKSSQLIHLGELTAGNDAFSNLNHTITDAFNNLAMPTVGTKLEGGNGRIQVRMVDQAGKTMETTRRDLNWQVIMGAYDYQIPKPDGTSAAPKRNNPAYQTANKLAATHYPEELSEKQLAAEFGKLTIEQRYQAALDIYKGKPTIHEPAALNVDIVRVNPVFSERRRIWAEATIIAYHERVPVDMRDQQRFERAARSIADLQIYKDYVGNRDRKSGLILGGQKAVDLYAVIAPLMKAQAEAEQTREQEMRAAQEEACAVKKAGEEFPDMQKAMERYSSSDLRSSVHPRKTVQFIIDNVGRVDPNIVNLGALDKALKYLEGSPDAQMADRLVAAQSARAAIVQNRQDRYPAMQQELAGVTDPRNMTWDQKQAAAFVLSNHALMPDHAVDPAALKVSALTVSGNDWYSLATPALERVRKIEAAPIVVQNAHVSSAALPGAGLGQANGPRLDGVTKLGVQRADTSSAAIKTTDVNWQVVDGGLQGDLSHFSDAQRQAIFKVFDNHLTGRITDFVILAPPRGAPPTDKKIMYIAGALPEDANRVNGLVQTAIAGSAPAPLMGQQGGFPGRPGSSGSAVFAAHTR